jgi:endogenous inhibitor of DNA gyrase (YacG/DUF329 family)
MTTSDTISGTCEQCGSSYEEPAHRVGRPRKYNYCSDLCRRRLSEAAHWTAPPIVHLPCARCGDVFQRCPGAAQRYCSSTCRNADRPRSKPYTTTCKACGTPFAHRKPTNTRPATYCSRKCYAVGKKKWSDEATAKTQRRAAERASGGLNRQQRQRLLRAWQIRGTPCTWCDSPADTVDHTIPITRGGTSHEGNLVPACRRCNSSRRDRLVIEWTKRPRLTSITRPPVRPLSPHPLRTGSAATGPPTATPCTPTLKGTRPKGAPVGISGANSLVTPKVGISLPEPQLV